MKIFRCEMLTTNKSVVRSCEGGKYPECSFCTLNLHPEKRVVKRMKCYRPPMIIIDDIGEPKKDINTQEALKKYVHDIKLIINEGTDE